jgi:hypothetical protein
VKTIRNDTRVKNSVLTPDGVTKKRNHTKCDKWKERHDNNHEQFIIIKRRLHNCGIMKLIIKAHLKDFPGWEGWDKIFLQTFMFKNATRVMIIFKIKAEIIILWMRYEMRKFTGELLRIKINLIKTK